MRKSCRAVASWGLLSLVGCGGTQEGTTVEKVGDVEVVTKTTRNPDGTVTTSTSFHQPNPVMPPPYRSSEGNFQVAFPGEPKVSEQVQPTPVGDQTIHIAQLVERRQTYTVVWSLMPKDLLRSQSADAFLDKTVESALKSQNWSALETQGTMIGPHPARDIKVEATSRDGGPPGLGWWRLALIGDRFYQIIAIAPTASGGAELQHDFVRSFTLLTEVPVAQAPPPSAPSNETEKPEPKADASASPATSADPGASSGGATMVGVAWIDDQQDRVGENGPDGAFPNGKRDEHVRVELTLTPNTKVESVVIARRDSNDRWESRPSDRFWPVAVYQGDQVVTAAHADAIGVFSGDQTFDLYCSTGSPLDGGSKLDVEVGLSIDGQPHTIRGTCEKPGNPPAVQAAPASPAVRRGPLGRRGPARRR